MEFGIVGTVVLLVSGLGSFALGRWLSAKRRARQRESDRQSALATQSRQVRRAQRRREKG